MSARRAKAAHEERALQRQAKQVERSKRVQLTQDRKRRQYGDAQWVADLRKFSEQLRAQGLCIRDVAGDGNCLFRSLADQLHGDAGRHAEVRAAVVDHIEGHRGDFEPFVEDDVAFGDYVAGMRRQGTWGGNLEIQAASVAFGVNVQIHQLGLPRWDVVNWPDPSARFIRLSSRAPRGSPQPQPPPAAGLRRTSRRGTSAR
eukprot:m51a1_g12918 hypothetical protein (201) ;mRNA; f:2085-2913